jgi:hypothetical protein
MFYRELLVLLGLLMLLLSNLFLGVFWVEGERVLTSLVSIPLCSRYLSNSEYPGLERFYWDVRTSLSTPKSWQGKETYALSVARKGLYILHRVKWSLRMAIITSTLKRTVAITKAHSQHWETTVSWSRYSRSIIELKTLFFWTRSKICAAEEGESD